MHADESMGDLDDKIKEDLAFRTEWAGKCTFGFKLSSVVPNVPKIKEYADRISPSYSYGWISAIFTWEAQLGNPMAPPSLSFRPWTIDDSTGGLQQLARPMRPMHPPEKTVRNRKMSIVEQQAAKP